MTRTEEFHSGAVRGKGVAGDEEGRFPLRYDLLMDNAELLKRLARTYGEGAEKYPARNWMKGFPKETIMNHLMAHLIQYAAGDTTEDHLAHAAWNIGVLMHQEVHHPELMK